MLFALKITPIALKRCAANLSVLLFRSFFYNQSFFKIYILILHGLTLKYKDKGPSVHVSCHEITSRMVVLIDNVIFFRSL